MLTVLLVLLILALVAGTVFAVLQLSAGGGVWERRARIEAERCRAERQLQALTMAAMGQLLNEARQGTTRPRP